MEIKISHHASECDYHITISPAGHMALTCIVQLVVLYIIFKMVTLFFTKK